MADHYYTYPNSQNVYRTAQEASQEYQRMQQRQQQQQQRDRQQYQGQTASQQAQPPQTQVQQQQRDLHHNKQDTRSYGQQQYPYYASEPAARHNSLPDPNSLRPYDNSRRQSNTSNNAAHATSSSQTHTSYTSTPGSAVYSQGRLAQSDPVVEFGLNRTRPTTNATYDHQVRQPATQANKQHGNPVERTNLDTWDYDHNRNLGRGTTSSLDDTTLQPSGGAFTPSTQSSILHQYQRPGEYYPQNSLHTAATATPVVQDSIQPYATTTYAPYSYNVSAPASEDSVTTGGRAAPRQSVLSSYPRPEMQTVHGRTPSSDLRSVSYQASTISDVEPISRPAMSVQQTISTRGYSSTAPTLLQNTSYTSNIHSVSPPLVPATTQMEVARTASPATANSVHKKESNNPYTTRGPVPLSETIRNAKRSSLMAAHSKNSSGGIGNTAPYRDGSQTVESGPLMQDATSRQTISTNHNNRVQTHDYQQSEQGPVLSTTDTNPSQQDLSTSFSNKDSRYTDSPSAAVQTLQQLPAPQHLHQQPEKKSSKKNSTGAGRRAPKASSNKQNTASQIQMQRNADQFASNTPLYTASTHISKPQTSPDPHHVRLPSTTDTVSHTQQKLHKGLSPSLQALPLYSTNRISANSTLTAQSDVQSDAQQSTTEVPPASRSPAIVESHSNLSESSKVSAPASKSDADIDAATMERHMREMVEKMREYQAANPAAFHAIWETVKKPARTAPAMALSKSTGVVRSPASTSVKMANTAQVENQNTLASSVGTSLEGPTIRQLPVSYENENRPREQPRLNVEPMKEVVPTVPPDSHAQSMDTTNDAEETDAAWPEKKTEALALAAVRLLSRPDLPLSPSVVMEYLNENPNFMGLCERLEVMGYAFERHRLAQELLAATRDQEELYASTDQPATTSPVAITGRAVVSKPIVTYYDLTSQEDMGSRHKDSGTPQDNSFQPPKKEKTKKSPGRPRKSTLLDDRSIADNANVSVDEQLTRKQSLQEVQAPRAEAQQSMSSIAMDQSFDPSVSNLTTADDVLNVPRKHVSELTPSSRASNDKDSKRPHPQGANVSIPRHLTPQSIRSFTPRDITESTSNQFHDMSNHSYVSPALVHKQVLPPAPPTLPSRSVGLEHGQLSSQKHPSSAEHDPSEALKALNKQQFDAQQSRFRINSHPQSSSADQYQPSPYTPGITYNGTPSFRKADPQLYQPVKANDMIRNDRKVHDHDTPINDKQSFPDTVDRAASYTGNTGPAQNGSATLILPSQAISDVSPMNKNIVDDSLLYPRRKRLPLPVPRFTREQARRTNKYDPKTIAWAVLIATGRHATMKPLNDDFSNLKKLHPDSFDNTSDLEEIPWQLYDPDPNYVDKVDSDIEMEGTAAVESRMVDVDSDIEIVSPHFSQSTTKTIAFDSDRMMMTKDVAQGDGITRSSTMGNHMTPKAQGIQNNQKSKPNLVDLTTITPRNKLSTSTNSPVESSIKRGRGRPRRNPLANSPATSVKYNKMSLTPNNDESESNKHKRPRLSVVSMPEPALHGSSDHGLSDHACRWENCGAELHNLPTLYKHVMKKHKPDESYGRYQCFWDGCKKDKRHEQPSGIASSVSPRDPASSSQRKEFPSLETWESHMLLDHLEKIRGSVGEGPIGGFVPINADTYKPPKSAERLSSRSITPISTPAPAGYQFTPPPGFPASKEFRKAHEPVKKVEPVKPPVPARPMSFREWCWNEELGIVLGGAGMHGNIPQWMKECKWNMSPSVIHLNKTQHSDLEDTPERKLEKSLEEQEKRRQEEVEKSKAKEKELEKWWLRD